ncbi:MAG: hypothetical protein ACREBW_05100 [Candidatus Micrarchaeaceae archaeon]
MADYKDSKSEITHGVISEVVLIVTPEMHAEIERKRLRREKVHLLGDELRGTGCGEIDLGDIDAPAESRER